MTSSIVYLIYNTKILGLIIECGFKVEELRQKRSSTILELNPLLERRLNHSPNHSKADHNNSASDDDNHLSDTSLHLGYVCMHVSFHVFFWSNSSISPCVMHKL